MNNQALKIDLQNPDKISRLIFDEIIKYRRTSKINDHCTQHHCQRCSHHHYPKILNKVLKNEPILFVLPAFPGKSPNLNKVIGPLPDYAEKLALSFLSKMCHQIKQIYKPGAKIIICSDGRVFSDVIGIKDSDVTRYQDKLDKLILEGNHNDLLTYNLDNYFYSLSFNQMRDELMKTYSQSLETLRFKVKQGESVNSRQEDKDLNNMYKGMTRFLFEDSLCPGQTQSRTFLQKLAKQKSYEVIRRSNAWSELIENEFPQCIRLSIHPQSCGSKKLGIRLVGHDSWMTPWHGVAVITAQGPILLKKIDAESMGATLVKDNDGLPSHYILNVTEKFYDI